MQRLALVVVFLIGVVGWSSAQDTANWTIMHYNALDNNLEGAAFNDYYEMQSVGSGNGVNIVTQYDRAEGFDTRFGDWTDTRRFYIEYAEPLPVQDLDGKRELLLQYFVAAGYGDADSLRPEVATLDEATVNAIYENNNVGVTFEQTPVAELGEVDMGDPQAFLDFILWGAQNYPAEHYMIIVGTHGGGWRGLGPDEGGGAESMLDLPEVDAVLTEARAQLGIEKFDIVGFDACLMGVVDVAVMLEPHADYVLFSQEVIPSNGWEYTHSITAMQENPDWDSFQVGANFVDNYMAYYAGVGNRTKVGLSLVETAGLPNLLATLENFSQVVGADTVELLSALGTARNNSQLFGTRLGDRADYFSYVDLRDFMTWFSVQNTITEDAYNAAQEVLAAYDGAVVYSLADSKLPGASGLGVYLPSSPVVYEAYGADYPVQAPASFAFWQTYLTQFYATIATELDGSALQLEMGDVFTVGGAASSTLDNPVVSFNAAGKGVVELSYTIIYLLDDGTRMIVDTSPLSYTTTLPTGEVVVEYPNELTPSTFTWGVEFPYISDGTNQVLGVLQASGSSGSEATVYGTYVTAQGSQPANLIFDLTTQQYVGMLAQAEGSVYEAKPAPGDQFIVDLVTITPEGEINVVPLADTPLTFGVEPFIITYLPAPSGNYEVGLSIGDLAGNSLFRKTAITVDNEGVDGALRGYTDTNEGVYFQYPRAWGESYSFTKENGTLTNTVSDRDGLLALYVDAYFEMDVESALALALEEVGVEVDEVVETTLGGMPALGANYAFETETGVTYGTMVAVFNELSNSTIVFTLHSSVEDAETDAAIIGVVDASLRFFAPILE